MSTLLEKGIEREEYVINKLKSEFPEDIEIIHQKTWGSDIIFKNGSTYQIEVKSARAFIKQKFKKRRTILRQGTFYICPHQVAEADYFAFVIVYNDHQQLFYVDGDNVRDLLGSRKKHAKRYAISIPQMKKLQPKTKFSCFLRKEEDN